MDLHNREPAHNKKILKAIQIKLTNISNIFLFFVVTNFYWVSSPILFAKVHYLFCIKIDFILY